MQKPVSGYELRLKHARDYILLVSLTRSQFPLTDSEYRACDFLIAYFIDNNSFYIIPKGEMRCVLGKKKIYWRYRLPVSQQDDLKPGEQKYLNEWGRLHPDFNKEIFPLMEGRMAIHQQIYERLIEVARCGELITYSEIAPLADLNLESAGDRKKISDILGEISTYEHKNNRPMLSAIVVLKDVGYPGEGFFTLARDLGLHHRHGEECRP